jgi:hypothetical protein
LGNGASSARQDLNIKRRDCSSGSTERATMREAAAVGDVISEPRRTPRWTSRGFSKSLGTRE